MAAGRLADGLRPRFGKDRVFLDVETIAAGENWAGRIRKAVETSQVLLVLIGRNWLNAGADEGQRRLDDPQDYVRLEVEHGLAQDHVRVIPVLLEEASIPRPQDLPRSIGDLSGLQAFTLAHASWEQDLNRLKRTLEDTLEPIDPAKQLANRVVGPANRIARETRVQAEKLRSTSRNFYAPSVDLSELADYLMNFFRSKRMDTQSFPLANGWQVQARHRGVLRAATGLLTSMDIILIQEGDDLVVHIGQGKWGDKVLVGAVGLWLPPLFFSSVYGVWRQTRLPGRTYQEVSNFLASRAKR